MRHALLAFLLTPLALAACKSNQASVVQTNATTDARLETINAHTPEDSRTMSIGQPATGGTQSSSH